MGSKVEAVENRLQKSKKPAEAGFLGPLAVQTSKPIV